MEQNYDIIIIGGGTAGCACAWQAGKLGLKTLLIEEKKYLGGAITSQLVVPAMKTDSQDLNVEFFDELIKLLREQKAQITYGDGNKGWFNPIVLPDVLSKLLNSVGVNVISDSCYDTIYIDNNDKEKREILSLSIVSNYPRVTSSFIYNVSKHNDNIKILKNEKIRAKFFVDATGDADFSKDCGASFLSDSGVQAMSLRFIASGINKKKFADWLLLTDKDRNVTTAHFIDNDIHFSTAYTWDNNVNWALSPFFEDAVKKNILKDTDRAYFQLFTIAGELDKVAFNCPRIISDKSYSCLTSDKISEIKEEALKVINRLLNFCKIYFPGFENAYIFKVADELGIRESRRVECEYTLTKEDIYNARKFETPVAFSNYPVDIHSVKKDSSTLNYVQKTYSIPLESLVVKNFRNLFVVGRCLGADFYAQAATRIQPTCFSMGVGLAKYLYKLIKNNKCCF